MISLCWVDTYGCMVKEVEIKERSWGDELLTLLFENEINTLSKLYYRGYVWESGDNLKCYDPVLLNRFFDSYLEFCGEGSEGSRDVLSFIEYGSGSIGELKLILYRG